MRVAGPVSLLKSAGSRLLDVVYPRECAACGVFMGTTGCFCWDCLRQAAKVTRPFCERCGDPVDGLVENVYECSWCAANRPLFDKARSVFRYRGPVMKAVQQLKYRGKTHLADGMAEILAAAARSSYCGIEFDLILGVPLFSRKERERGYNQAALLAEGIAKIIRSDSCGRALVRVRDTETQTKLSSAQRKRNVKSAFKVQNAKRVMERRVLLVDDVVTTGATAAEVSRALKDAGACSVHVISLARG